MDVKPTKSYISEKMESEPDKPSSWSILVELASSAISNAVNNLTIEANIMKRLDQEDATNLLMDKDTIQNMAKEIITICRSETLPTQTDHDNEIIVKKFWTLNYQENEIVECYCHYSTDKTKIKGECTFLKGGILDGDYYVALAHELTSTLEGHRGLVITTRHDTSIRKQNMIVPLLAIWDLYRMLARMEGIEMEQMLPTTMKNTPTHHSNSLIIKIKKEHKGILADIGNTILTIWPRYLEIALGHLGKYMPVELHINMPATEYNKYTHATTKLMDFKENGLHKHITYPGVYNKHRKPSNKALRIVLDHAPGITPNLMEKIKHIVDLIKAADRTVNTRIIELAAAGVNLNHISEEQVRIPQNWKYNVTLISKILVNGNIPKEKHCLDDSRRRRHRNLTKPWKKYNYNREIYAQHTWTFMIKYNNCKFYNTLFFRIRMEIENNVLFSSQKRKHGNEFPPGSPMLTLELMIATDWIGKFQEQIEDLSESDNEREIKEILYRYSNRMGSEPIRADSEHDTPFMPGQDMGVRNLPREPREGDRMMPKGIRLEWGNLQEEKQESFIRSLLAILPTLTNNEKARVRTVRQGGDSTRTKEIQYREPYTIEQFHHIGLINNLFQYKEGKIENLPFAPLRIHLDINIAGNSIDREYIPYSIPISIRNLTISHKGTSSIEDLVNETFPALNGARVANWYGKSYTLDENGAVIRTGLWYTVIHGKMAEWIVATGRVSLRDSQPLQNQICFEEFQMNLPVHCTQCQRWGDHRAYEAGLTGCSAPGFCQYCGQGTSRTLYKLHENECKDKNVNPICAYCKREGSEYNHSASNPTDCHISRSMIKGVIASREARQKEYNERFVTEITRRVLIKGSNPVELMKARSNIWKGAQQTETYLSLIANLSGMEDISSNWDSKPEGKIIVTITLTLSLKSIWKHNLTNHKLHSKEYYIQDTRWSNKIIQEPIEIERETREVYTEEGSEAGVEEGAIDLISPKAKETGLLPNKKAKPIIYTRTFFQAKCDIECKDKGRKRGKNTETTGNKDFPLKPSPTIVEVGKKTYDHKLLLRAGDIEPNPGPDIPETPILDEQNFYVTFDIPDIELFPHKEFQFEEMAITSEGKEIIKQKCYNHIYSCPYCISINECFKKFMFFYIGKKITMSNTMVAVIIECLKKYRCAFCLEYTSNNPNTYLPDGFTCGQDCETNYMNKFICTFDENEKGIKFLNIHRSRAQWIKYLGLRAMNNIGRIPTCGEHFTYKICLLDSINLNGISDWIDSPINTIKERKLRANKKVVKKINKDHIIKLIHSIAGGAMCAGEKCLKSLWLYQGKAEYDDKIGLQYCSLKCQNTRPWNNRLNIHEAKINIIQASLMETYDLGYVRIYQEPRVGGASLMAQLNNFTAREHLHPNNNITPGSKIKGTCKMVTWNMQGANNWEQARQFLNQRKPAVLCLQEAKINDENRRQFQNKNYNTFFKQNNNDLITFIRKDYKATIIEEDNYDDISTLITEIAAEGDKITIINLYARDGKLKGEHLEYYFENYKKTIILGDFNAKHLKILPHTQKVPYNRNGIQLKKYLEGKLSIDTSQPPVHIHNISDEAEWTHVTPNGNWAQIDYIMSHNDITHKIINTSYEYELISDHQGLSVMAPELFPEVQTLSKLKYVPDWKTYDPWNYKLTTEMMLEAAVITGRWYEKTIEERIHELTEIQKMAMNASISYKLISNRGNTKPRKIINLIKQKRKLENGLRKLASDTRKKREEAYQIIFDLYPTQYKYHYTKNQYKHWESNQQRYRTEIHQLAKRINYAILEQKKKNWEAELTKLGETDIKKAPREFYSSLKRLGGASKNGSNIRKMEYKGNTACTEIGIANIMANSAQDTFKPLDDPHFDYQHFQNLINEWEDAQEALEKSNNNVNSNSKDLQWDNFTWLPNSATLREGKLNNSTNPNTQPNLTKHQVREWDKDNKNQYKKIKEILPEAPKLNIPVDKEWNEGLAHNCETAVRELNKIYKKFDTDDLNKVINKMKRKAPGHDKIMIDQFKDLGEGGKRMFLEVINEIYEKGDFPDIWKQAIMVPILKKDKPAKDPASYRPISLLPVGAKIVEALVLSKINPYLEKRGLIPIIQTGFRKGESTSTNLKRIYTNTYTKTIRASHPQPTILVCFDAKKAFDSVWHIGLFHKCMRDGIPAILIRFLRSWFHNRTMKIKIGEEYSRSIKLESGVPQGSVLAPELWNYSTGDIPTTRTAHSDTAVYADDASSANSHRNLDTLLEITQKEIWQLEEWTRMKRIKFEPTKTNILAISKKPETRREIKKHTLFLDKEKTEKLKYTEHAKLLGITFSETGTFHKHFGEKLKTCYARIKQLHRFVGYVQGDTLYKVYRTAIEPIILYGTEVLYENLSCNLSKKLIALEITAIKMAYGLPRQTSIIDCLHLLKDEGIIGRIEKRRSNFVDRNKNSALIRYGESLKYSQGRRIRIKNNHTDRSVKHKTTWKGKLHLHKPHLFFSDVNPETDDSPNSLQRHNSFKEGFIATSPTRFPDQEIKEVRFVCKPEYSRRTMFDPG